jgi:hypothetical protein
MTLPRIILALTLPLALLVGCDDKKNQAPPAAPAATPTPPAVDHSAHAPEPARPAETPKPADTLTEAQKAAAAAAAAAKEEAGKLLDQLQNAITQKNWADAQSIIQKLAAYEEKLSPELKAKLEAFKKQVTDQARNLLQGLPGLGGGGN